MTTPSGWTSVPKESSRRPVDKSSLRKDDNYRKLKCGCEMSREDGMFIIKPCSPNCPIYLYVLAKTQQLGHPIHYIPVKE